MIISVILPTRCRPIQAKKFLESLYINSHQPDQVELIICIDDDDDSYNNFHTYFEKTIILRSPRTGMGQITYEGICKSKGEIILLCNDDVIVKTKGWDDEFRKIHRFFPDHIYLMSPNDENKSNSLFVFPTFSRKLFNLLCDYPRIYKGAFIDTHLHEIFKSLKYKGHDRIVFLEHIRFTHNHFRVTGEKPDKTYLDRKRFGDDRNFLCTVQQRITETEVILSVINGEEKLKKYENLTLTPLQSIFRYLFSNYLPLNYRIHILIYLMARNIYKVLKNEN